MLFNSLGFILVFAPITYALFFASRLLLGIKWSLIVLVAASLVFYSWWNIWDLPILIASMAFNYAAFLALLWTDRKKAALAAAISANLCLLIFYKYREFLFGANAGSFSSATALALPLGISFFTFTQIGFLVDAYRRRFTERSPLNYVLFISFFPHLIAGPIIHYANIVPQFTRHIDSAKVGRLLAVGLTIFAIGLFKKVGLADSMQVYVNSPFATANGVPLAFMQAWLAAIAFTLQIYFDFSAYSDMAVGLAYMLGVRLPLNFNSPLQAASIIEFWRRWHITLSSFLRDYLYIPLGGGRKGFSRQIANILIVMALGGLWHGAGVTFLIWGCLHGIFIALNHCWRRVKPNFILVIPRFVRVPIGWALTFFCVVVAFVIFRAESPAAAINVLTGMAGLNGIDNFMGGCELARIVAAQCPYRAELVNGTELMVRSGDYIQVWFSILACIGIVLLLPNTARFMRRARPVTFEKDAPPVAALLSVPAWRPTVLWAALTVLMFFYGLSEIENARQFIYFQF